MTNAELRIEIKKLYDQRVSFSDNDVLYNHFSILITELERKLYKNNPAALKHLGL